MQFPSLGVTVGGEHDAGVAEHRLYDFEVVAGGEGQAGRAVAQVMQPDRRQVGVADQAVEQLAEPVGFDRVKLCVPGSARSAA